MKRLFILIALLVPMCLWAQVDYSELSMPELSKKIEAEARAIKASEAKGDKLAMSHSLGNAADLYLAVARKLSESEETDQIEKAKQTSLTRSIDYSRKAIAASEDVGDLDQMRTSYRTLIAAQKLSGDIKGSLQSSREMLALKKTVFSNKKVAEMEKRQIEYQHTKREDSIRQQKQAAEDHLKEQARVLAMKQKQLDSTSKTLTAAEEEKTNVSMALKKTQSDLTMEKLNALEKERKLTLVEEEQALQATSIQLQNSKLELQQSELALQRSKMELQENELQIKDRKLSNQRLYIYIGVISILVLASFLFFIVRERKKAIQQKLRAERSERFKQEFIANISHEIRTPMNAIIGMTGLLIQKNPSPEQDSYLKAISKSADILLHVINDVLDLSKIEAGKLELEKIDFSLTDTLKQVKDTLSYRAEDKGLQLITTVDDKLSDVIVGDPFRLNQVLINLGGNALKFTEKGGVHIDVTKEKEEGEYVWVKYAIVDTGIGIPADKVSKLFESFSQVKSSDTRKYGGTGLGLSISKHLVELQGGNISVESVVGKGTTFSFIIRYPVGSAERLQQRLASEQNADGTILNGLRILIADDNEYNRLVVNETLHLMADVETDEVVNGQEAVDLLKANNYDLILMDVQMPVMNGIDATRYIRGEMKAPKKDIPIIALTASVLRADLDLCFESGMTAYVPKPFKPWQLVNTIAEVTGRERQPGVPSTPKQVQKKQADKTKQQPAKAEPAKEEPAKQDASVAATEVTAAPASFDWEKVTNMDYLTTFCEGDQKRMQKYIKVYLNALPAFHKNIAAAIENKDFVELALHVHSFKPKWMMMGMKKTNDLGVQIDHMAKSQNEKAFEDVKTILEDIDKSQKELEVMV